MHVKPEQSKTKKVKEAKEKLVYVEGRKGMDVEDRSVES